LHRPGISKRILTSFDEAGYSLEISTWKLYHRNSFFSGRVLNRFSKDMGAVDEQLPKAMLEAIQV